MTDDAVTRTIQFEGDVDTLSVRKYWLRPSEGSEQCIENRLIYVGASPDNHFVLNNPTVSRVHCKIEADGKRHRIRDLESKNGTFINDVRVNDAYLPSECSVRVGDATFSFSLADESVEVQLTRHNQFGDLLGESLQMREIFGLLSRVAPTNATVLVEGQSGTGKELVADALHRESPRKDKPFVVFDCSAVPRDLVESELFGHIKGSFTGATANRNGAFEEANGGTLFLDEIGELPLDLQPRLLRVLEKREVKPVGSNEVRPVDVRIVAATNRNLSLEVKEGNFREDLYYRLAVIRVLLPPLHKRVEDIPLLVKHFVGMAQEQLGIQSQAFEINFETMTKLQHYQWPGNVRELKNFIERAALLAGDEPIDTRFIGGEPNPTPSFSPAQGDSPSAPGGEALSAEYSLPFKDAKSRLIEQFEYTYWSRLLSETKGNVSEAARRGGIHRKSLEYLLKKIDLAAKELSSNT
jgi:DNA-binding NtrC family response regulator